MTDDQVEKLIWDELKKRDVTIYDMTGLPNYGVDPTPKNKTEAAARRSRSNRFRETFGSGRIKELLSEGEYNPYEGYPPLKIPFQDLFSFWWNRCIDQYSAFDEILEDIFQYFTEQMRPPQKEPEEMDLTVDFEELPIFSPQEESPRQTVIGENPPESM
jgi:hypothetical protein